MVLLVTVSLESYSKKHPSFEKYRNSTRIKELTHQILNDSIVDNVKQLRVCIQNKLEAKDYSSFMILQNETFNILLDKRKFKDIVKLYKSNVLPNEKHIDTLNIEFMTTLRFVSQSLAIMKRYDEALIGSMRMLKLLKLTSKYPDVKAIHLNSIALTHYKAGDHTNAVKYYSKAYEEILKVGDLRLQKHHYSRNHLYHKRFHLNCF